MQKISEANSYYMGLVQNLYAGKNGCLTAFLQFFYQFQISHEMTLADCLKILYQTEIENCLMLGKILQEMGADPQYYSSSRRHLGTQSVCYVKDANKIFLADIELLEINIIDLKSAISKIDNPEIKVHLKKVLDSKKASLKLLKQNYFRANVLD